MTPLVKALRCLAELCGVVVDGDGSGGGSEAGTASTWRSRLPKGPALLSGLYNRARTESISAIDGQGLVPLPEADSVTPLVPLWKLLRWLLRRTMAPFLTMLWRWSFQGDLPAQADPEVRCMQLASGETPSSTHTLCLLASTTATTTTTTRLSLCLHSVSQLLIAPVWTCTRQSCLPLSWERLRMTTAQPVTCPRSSRSCLLHRRRSSMVGREGCCGAAHRRCLPSSVVWEDRPLWHCLATWGAPCA